MIEFSVVWLLLGIEVCECLFFGGVGYCGCVGNGGGFWSCLVDFGMRCGWSCGDVWCRVCIVVFDSLVVVIEFWLGWDLWGFYVCCFVFVGG